MHMYHNIAALLSCTRWVSLIAILKAINCTRTCMYSGQMSICSTYTQPFSTAKKHVDLEERMRHVVAAPEKDVQGANAWQEWQSIGMLPLQQELMISK